MLGLSLGLVIAVQTATPVQAATITSNRTGSWDTGSTWNGGVVPSSTDNVIIQSGHNVNTNNVNRYCGDLTIYGTLTITDGEVVFVQGGGSSPTTTGAVSGNGTIVNSAGSNGGTDIKLYGNWSFSGTISGYFSVAFQGPNDATISATPSGTTIRNIYCEKNAGTTLYFSVTPSHSNNFQILTTGTICYNQAGNQIVKPNPTTGTYLYYPHLTIAGSGIKTMTGVTVDGVFSIEGTATASVAPTYRSAATLQYNTATARTAGPEWITTFAATGGVIIDNTGTITLNAAKTFNAGVPLTINSGATLSTNSTSNYALTLGGDFVNNGTFTANGSAITIQGNWINNGTFSYGTSTVTLSGTSPQTMTGATTFYNLILNNNGLTINNDETVSNTLTLTNGKITTGANTVIIPASGSVSRTNGWVIGNLQKNVANGSSVSRTFEVGATNYDPVIVAFTSVSVAGNLTAEATAGEHPDIGTSKIDSSKDVNVYWSFTNSGINFTNYSATFNFSSGDIDVSANTTKFIVGKYSGNWTYPTVGAKNSTSTQATGMTSFSDFAVGAVNNPPTSANNTVTTPKNTSYVFSTSDFPFTDADPGDTLQKVQITTLETVGALKYGSADVTLNQEITAADIAAGNLTFVPGACGTGSPYTTFGFKASDGRDYSSSAYTMTINVITQVTFRSVGSSPGADSATCVITKPSGLTVGDLMIAQVVGTDYRFSGDIGAFTAPAGWTGIRQDTAVNGAYEYLASALFWKTANATDVAASSFTFTATTANSNRGTITVWYGQNSTNPINAHNGLSNAASTTVTAPTITPSVANCMILLFCGIYDDNTQSGYAIATSNPPSWAEAYDLLYNDTYDLGLSLGYATRSQTTATGSGTATTSGSDYNIGQLVAIAPSQQAWLGASAANNGPVCEGATLTLTGGPGGMTSYSWTGPNGFSSTSQSPTVSTNTTLAMAGTYTLTVTDSGGCSDQAGTSVTVNAKPAATASSNSPVCEGGTIQLTGGPSGAYTYSWSGPNGFSNTTQSPTVSTNATTAMAGTYSLTVTNSTTGCVSNPASTTVVVNAKPTATASSNSPVCEGSTIILTGGPGGMSTYNWTGPSGFSSSLQSPTVTTNATLAMAGTYTLTVTNNNGCSASNTTSVFVENCPTDYYTDWVSYCNGTSIWRTRDLHDYYCFNGTCSENITPESEWYQDCPTDYYTEWASYCNDTSIWRTRDFHDYYCFNGTCQEDVIPESEFVENCPADYYTSWVSYCNDTSIWRTRDLHDYYCFNGTCQEDVIPESEFVENCPADYYTDWVSYCNDTSIWRTRDFHDYYCFNGTCQEDVIPESEFVENCPTYYRDFDSDSYGNATATTQNCTQPAGYVLDSSDCDDSNAAINPNTVWYHDSDSDTFGNVTDTKVQCTQPAGYVLDSSDCDDSNAAVNPGATEVCNGIDDNCNGNIDEGCAGLTYTISGIIQVGGVPLAGVLVTAHSPWTGTAITDADGKYELTGVPYGETELHITPTLAGYTFDPPTITVTGPVTAPIENQDFAAAIAAQEGCPDSDYPYPTTFAKIPFAIVESGFILVGQLMDTLAEPLGLPDWLTPDLFNTIGSWAGGPLSWSVDMLGWGLSVVGSLLDALADPLGLPEWLAPTVNTIACQLFTPFSCSVTGVAFSPCG